MDRAEIHPIRRHTATMDERPGGSVITAIGPGSFLSHTSLKSNLYIDVRRNGGAEYGYEYGVVW